MPQRRAVALASLLVACAAVSACDSAITAAAAGPEAGRYVATTLDGHPLPVLTDSSAEGFGVLLADTLELDGRGGARRAPVVRRFSTVARTDAVYRPEFAHEYRVTAGQVVVGALSCGGPNVLCPAADSGSLGDGGLTLRTIQYGGRATALVFHRVSQ